MFENNSITPVQQRVLVPQFEQLLFELKKLYTKALSLDSAANAMALIENGFRNDSTLDKIENKLLGTGLHADRVAELFDDYVKAHDPEFYELLQTTT